MNETASQTPISAEVSDQTDSGLYASRAAVRRTLLNLLRERTELLEEIQQLKAAVQLYREVNQKLEARAY